MRAAFANCTKGEARRFSIPTTLDAVASEDLDSLGWRDPQSIVLGGMALWRDDELVSIALRATTRPAAGDHRRRRPGRTPPDHTHSSTRCSTAPDSAVRETGRHIVDCCSQPGDAPVTMEHDSSSRDPRSPRWSGKR
ncbi:FBP domain-containing protein [Aestuariimicrobium sp. p3-SID1156]|uniref:FBP domain-containing protein n=1 Tax=Aestuariimicrobium sp. p3-SID1156 TaxID=2916038 RepID=UPI0037BE50E3